MARAIDSASACAMPSIFRRRFRTVNSALHPPPSCGCLRGRLADTAALMDDLKRRLGEIPSIDKLLTADWAKALLRQNARAFVVAALRRACDSLRDDVRAGRFGSEAIDGAIQKRALTELSRSGELKPIEVVNATGVVLHTNLGRALLPDEAVEALVESRGQTRSRSSSISNRAAAGTATRWSKRICARSRAPRRRPSSTTTPPRCCWRSTRWQRAARWWSRAASSIEIGGSFRIPDVLAKSGATLREVGTTNRTHVADYLARRSDRDTAALLKVHTSNYRVRRLHGRGLARRAGRARPGARHPGDRRPRQRRARRSFVATACPRSPWSPSESRRGRRRHVQRRQAARRPASRHSRRSSAT